MSPRVELFWNKGQVPPERLPDDKLFMSVLAVQLDGEYLYTLAWYEGSWVITDRYGRVELARIH